ncbi:DNA phosphorothioation system sulfurtransferase DndC [bacterium]|nr:DNA phosphorothioation system sulfurtransferase DndC [bacterium]
MVNIQVPIVANERNSIFDLKPIDAFIAEVQEVYLADNSPWVLGYSGGKDSTATLQLVWMAIKALPPKKRHKTVYVISSDTFVETPVIVGHIDTNLDAINTAAKAEGLPFEAHKVVPEVTDTFWVCLLGKGYPAPTTRFRWCTERMKISPADKFILSRVAEFGEVVMVLGARRGESATRDQVMKNREIHGSRLRKHSSLLNAFVYAPIEEFSTNDVWTYILQGDNGRSPWGADNSELVGMYKSAAGGECPLVVDNSTPSCGNSRFGCWVCTVVEKDHSMESLVDNGEEWMEPLLDFRNKLATHRLPEVKRKIRSIKRRDGRVWRKKNDDGSEGTPIPGPYLFEFRCEMLRELLEIEQQVRREGPDSNARLIREDELKEIRKIWRTEEQDWQDSVPKIYREVTGEELLGLQDDVTSLTSTDASLLQEVCSRHDVPTRLVGKLLDLERDMQGMSRRAGIFKQIDKVFREDWKEEIRAREEVDAMIAAAEADGEENK